MNAQSVWTAFCEKLQAGTLSDNDFTEEAKGLSFWLTGDRSIHARQKFRSVPVEFYDMEGKASVMLKCEDDDYRFDFVPYGESFRLAFMECITLPVFDIKRLPYSDFIPLPDKENELRREKEISRTVWNYLKFKELLSKEEAIKIFIDGKGESIGARSWVPFYSDSLAYIAYAAWIENRLYGEETVLEEFTESRCVIRLKKHFWRRLYFMSGHLKTQINYDEYMELFQAIWSDRAKENGWKINFIYDNDDTVMIYVK
jgi:hypothetical protein